jgi:hypothetical protein
MYFKNRIRKAVINMPRLLPEEEIPDLTKKERENIDDKARRLIKSANKKPLTEEESYYLINNVIGEDAEFGIGTYMADLIFRSSIADKSKILFLDKKSEPLFRLSIDLMDIGIKYMYRDEEYLTLDLDHSMSRFTHVQNSADFRFLLALYYRKYEEEIMDEVSILNRDGGFNKIKELIQKNYDTYKNNLSWVEELTALHIMEVPLPEQ